MSRDFYTRGQPKRFHTHFHSPRKQVRDALGKLSAGEQDTVSKNNLTEITWVTRPDLGLTLLPFSMSCNIIKIFSPLALSCCFHVTFLTFVALEI